ncbi:MAG: hypothetical protein V1887_02895 [Candidatus Aenigmatarchaeota archaeon]
MKGTTGRVTESQDRHPVPWAQSTGKTAYETRRKAVMESYASSAEMRKFLEAYDTVKAEEPGLAAKFIPEKDSIRYNGNDILNDSLDLSAAVWERDRGVFGYKDNIDWLNRHMDGFSESYTRAINADCDKVLKESASDRSKECLSFAKDIAAAQPNNPLLQMMATLVTYNGGLKQAKADSIEVEQEPKPDRWKNVALAVGAAGIMGITAFAGMAGGHDLNHSESLKEKPEGYASERAGVNPELYDYSLPFDMLHPITQIINSSADDLLPTVWEDKVAFARNDNGNWGIWMKNISTGTERRIFNTTGNNPVSEVLFFDKVIGYSDGTSGAIRCYECDDEFSPTKLLCSKLSPSYSMIKGADIWEKKLVFSKEHWVTGLFGSTLYQDVYWSDVYKNDTNDVTENYNCNNEVSMCKDFAIYHRDGLDPGVYRLYNTATDKVDSDVNLTNDTCDIDMYQRQVILNTNFNGTYLVNLDTKEKTLLLQDKPDISHPRIYGNRIVWAQNKDIYMMELDKWMPQVFPPARFDVVESHPFFSQPVSASNPSGPVYFSDDSPLFDIDRYSGIISFTPNQVGTFPFKITVIDDYGNSATGQSEMIVTQNNPPVISNAPQSLQGKVNKLLYYKFNTFDPDGDKVKVHADGVMENAMDPDTGELRFTPNSSHIGSRMFNVFPTDVYGKSGSGVPIKLDVLDNMPPEISGVLANLIAYAYKPFSFKPNVTDPESDPFNVTVDGILKDRMNPRNGEVYFIPDNSEAGTYPMSITATDSGGGSSTVKTTLNIIKNSPPEISGFLSYAEARVGRSFGFKPIIIDPEGDSFTVTYAGDGLEHAFWINDRTGEISFMPDNSQVGLHDIDITATDIHGNPGIAKLNLNILRNSPPEITGLPPNLTLYSGKKLVVTPAITDFEGDTYEAYANGILTYAVDKKTGKISFTPKRSDEGFYNVTYSAIDKYSRNDQKILLQIIASNKAPAFSGLSDRIKKSVPKSCIITDNSWGENFTYMDFKEPFKITRIKATDADHDAVTYGLLATPDFPYFEENEVVTKISSGSRSVYLYKQNGDLYAQGRFYDFEDKLMTFTASDGRVMINKTVGLNLTAEKPPVPPGPSFWQETVDWAYTRPPWQYLASGLGASVGLMGLGYGLLELGKRRESNGKSDTQGGYAASAFATWGSAAAAWAISADATFDTPFRLQPVTDYLAANWLPASGVVLGFGLAAGAYQEGRAWQKRKKDRNEQFCEAVRQLPKIRYSTDMEPEILAAHAALNTDTVPLGDVAKMYTDLLSKNMSERDQNHPSNRMEVNLGLSQMALKSAAACLSSYPPGKKLFKANKRFSRTILNQALDEIQNYNADQNAWAFRLREIHDRFD